jgi:poly(A) polymerase
MTARGSNRNGVAGPLADMARYVRSRGGTGYIVGGAVRDALLGRTSDNIDIALENLEPADLAEFLRKRRGFARPVVFKKSGTVFTHDGKTEVEISPLRGDLARDALERDFTVNCLYVRLKVRPGRIARSAVLDPTGRGLRDLSAGKLVAYPDSFTPFAADPVRLLRAVRFRATLGFSIERPLKEAMARTAYLVSRSAAERVRLELERILLSARVISSFRFMYDVGLLEMIMPEVAVMADLDQGSPYHAYDLLTHSLKATAYVRRDLTLRLAALLHDIGKVSARRRKGTRTVYYGHEKISAESARAILRRLKFPTRVSNDVAFLIENHMVNYSGSWTDAAVRRFMRKMDRRLDAVLDLAAADRRAHAPDTRMGAPAGDLGMRIATVAADMESREVSFKPPLDGRQIMELLGIDEGPGVGRAKEYLCQAVLRRGRAVSREEALRILRKWATLSVIDESK